MEENRYQLPENFTDSVEEQRFWRKVVADQVESRLGNKKFCEQHKLSFIKFRYWKYSKIRPDCIDAGNKTAKVLKQYPGKKVNKFISLQISPEGGIVNQAAQNIIVGKSSREIEVIFKNGHKIKLPEGITENNLALLIREVGELRC